MAKNYDVFISYRRSDGKDMAVALREYLTGKGLYVFLDEAELVDGKYFNEQLREHVSNTSNYILIASPDVFNFRDGEDWVREEITLALNEHNQSLNESDNSLGEHVFLPVVPAATVFPDKSALPVTVQDMALPNRIGLAGDMPTDSEMLRIYKAVCGVSQRNLWNAGQRWLENSRKEGARFHSLDIVDTILPRAKKKTKKNTDAELPINVTVGEGDAQPLFDAMDAQSGHMYLIGEGGIGKTTSLVKIMRESYENTAYEKDAVIPLFIELSHAPILYGNWYENGVSTFIRYEIYRQLRSDRSILQLGQATTETPAALEEIDKLLREDTVSPKYLLLLDGLNEASLDKPKGALEDYALPIRQMVCQEIITLLKECGNVRIMLTSRSDQTEIKSEGDGYTITKLTLTGIDDDTISSFLSGKGYDRRAVNSVLENKPLLECLRIPLFLTMYAALSKAGEICSRGEILRAFFGERRPEGEYSQRNRTAQTLINTDKQFAVRSVSAKQQELILDFLLPEIAREMEKQNEFYVDPEFIAEVIEPVLTGTGDTDICGRYGKQCFDRSIARVARGIAALGEDMVEVAEYIADFCTDSLGIMQQTNGLFGFIHQHVRDYFAALCEINTLRLAVRAFERKQPDIAFTCLERFNEDAVRPVKATFMGEYLGEHHNKPVHENGKWQYVVPTKAEDRNLNKRALDIYRGRFDGEVGYGVYNLVEAMKVRTDFSGEDLSKLDLRLCTLNSTRMGREGGFGADLYGSLLGMENLLCMGHNGLVSSVCYSPDGKRICSGSWDKTIKEWDAVTWQNICTYKGHTDRVLSVSYSPDGKRICSGSLDKTVKEWDTSTGLCTRTYEGHTGGVESVCYTQDGKRICSGSEDKTIKEWDAATELCIRTYKGHTGSVYSVSYSPDGMRICSGSEDKTIKEWDTATGHGIRTYEGHTDRVTCVRYSTDGRSICSGSWDKTIKEWNMVTGECIHTYEGHINSVRFVSYSPDGRRICSGANDRAIKEWNVATGECIRTYKGHMKPVTSIDYSPDGKHICSGTDYSIKEWDGATGACVRTYEGHKISVYSVSYSPDSTRFCFGGDDNTIKEWDAATGQYIRTYEGHTGWVYSVCYSPDSKRICSGAGDNTIKEWDITTGECVCTYEGHANIVRSVSYSPNGKFICSGAYDKTIREWDTTNGQCIRTYMGHAGGIESVCYSPDGKHVCSGAVDKTIKEWDVVTGQCVRTYEGHTSIVTSISYGLSGNRICSGSCDNTIKEWDTYTGKCIRTYKGRAFVVLSINYSPLGERICSGSYTNAINEWNTATGECIHTYRGHLNEVKSVIYSPDGKRIYSGSYDGTVRIWSTETGECLDVIQNYPGLIVNDCDFRNLHPDSKVDKEILRCYGAIVD